MTAAEDTKNIAEAAKFNAEADVAKRLAALHDANADLARARAANFTKEAEKFEVEALNLELQNKLVRIAADAATREEEDHLATDRYHHIYTFNGAINDSSVRQCITMLTNWMRKNPACDIEIVFNSPGGSVVDGMALFDFIQLIRSKGHKVTTSTLGMAASMAGILLQAGNVRVMGSQSWLMIHEACEPADSLVYTPDLRLVRQGDLQVGDELLAFDEKGNEGGYRKWRIATVEAAGRAQLPCVAVHLSDGTTKVTSTNHLWLAGSGSWPQGWVKSDQMNQRPWQGFTKIRRPFAEVHEDPSREAGWMAGLYDGEGSISRTEGVTGLALDLVQCKGDVLDRAQLWLGDHGFNTYENIREATDKHRETSRLYMKGGVEEVVRLLATIRPERLLQKFPSLIAGMRMHSDLVSVVATEPAGIQEVVTLRTSTKTYLSSGIAMHNSFGAGGKIGEVEDVVEWVKMVQERILDIFAERSSMTKQQIRTKWRRKDWWLSSDAALEAGFVDEIR